MKLKLAVMKFSDLAAKDPIDPADGLEWLDDNLPPELRVQSN